MGHPKPFASLSSGLLARKGQAKPAMRPQGYSGFGSVNEAIDDLGWNDMGLSDAQPVAAVPAPTIVAAPMPPVLQQRDVLHHEFATAPAAPAAAALSPEPQVDERAEPRIVAVPPARTKRRRRTAAVEPRDKAAFTLRLDAGRHLRLRLASALARQSAQQLVTAALDEYLKTLPEVESMAIQLSGQALGNSTRHMSDED